jgi:hypothetical protein
MICPELDPNGPSPLQLLRLCSFASLRLCVSCPFRPLGPLGPSARFGLTPVLIDGLNRW